MSRVNISALKCYRADCNYYCEVKTHTHTHTAQRFVSPTTGSIEEREHTTTSHNRKYACNEVSRASCQLHVISLMSLQQNTSYTITPRSAEHFLKCLLTFSLRVDSRLHKPQENCLYSECTGWWCLNSCAAQKRFGHSLQTWGFTPSCCWTCTLRWWQRMNFYWISSSSKGPVAATNMLHNTQLITVHKCNTNMKY